MFLRQAIEKEDAVYQAQNGQRNLAEQLKDGLTPYQISLLEKVTHPVGLEGGLWLGVGLDQISLLEKVRRANTDPIVPNPQ